MKRHLQIDEQIDFSLLGISCHMKDYRLTWEINQVLGMDFEKGELLYKDGLSDGAGFATSAYMDEDLHLDYLLISNKGSEGVLIAEHPRLDFFLRIAGPQHEYEVDSFRDALNSINSVLTVVKINPEELKARSSLLF